MATIVDLSVLLLRVYVPEKDIASLKIGQTAIVNLDQVKTQAKAAVTYISKVADPKTHTFLVELTLDNKKLLLPEGLTATVDLQQQTEPVHVLSPSTLMLDDQGSVGVMIVDQDHKAVFNAVEVLQSSHEKICVRGLPETAMVISIGGEFIKNGHVVEPILANKGDATP